MLNRYIKLHGNDSVDFILKLAISVALLLTLGPVMLDIKGTIPITLQSFVVLFTAIAFGWQIGSIATLIYIIAGVSGLPVFAGYTSDLDKLFGPFGGFFFGFIASAVICGFIAEKEGYQKPIPAMMLWFLGHAIILLLGIIWLSRFDPLGWKEKLESVIPGSVIKSVVGALIIQLVIKFYRREKKRAFEE